MNHRKAAGGAIAASDNNQLAVSYGALFERLLPGVTGSAFFGQALQPLGGVGALAFSKPLSDWLGSLGWGLPEARPTTAMRELPSGSCIIAMPLTGSQTQLRAAVCIEIDSSTRVKLGSRVIERVAAELKPALDCLQREARILESGREAAAAADRTEDLEWLFNVAANIKRTGGDSVVLQQLLAAACEKVPCSLGLLHIPDKQISLTHSTDEPNVKRLKDGLGRIQPHLLAWATRRREPLVVSAPPRTSSDVPPVKLLSVPVLARSGRVIGILSFFRPPQASGFSERQQFLANHLARQVSQLIESQFDLMTGLASRAALEQTFEHLCRENAHAPRSLVYIDIDQLHVCNETHGFELGDEIIVRVADLLSSNLVPRNGFAGRISGDCFAVILDRCDPREALGFTSRLQEAAAAIHIGLPDEPLSVSVSCGVAAIVDMPKGFARALAAAELACKAAKDRGRNRTELYACEDSSMMRRHDDVIAVGQLREAIRSERLVLFAQSIVRLDTDRQVCGFELLLRMREGDGSLKGPGEFMSAAQRYQLLPQIDRYVVRHALELASPYASVLRELRASLSINVSGQSLADESFIRFFLEKIRESRIGPGFVTCEITEQTAVASLAKAADMMRELRRAGCGVALDDFGIGANTFAYLKGLPATRIKIDGSFVKDMLTNARSAAMVKSLVSLAKELGMDTVAEHVESDALARELSKIGVDYGQGYALGRPEALESVLKNLRDDESRRMRGLWLES